jgi:hypothetical protein
VADEASGSTAGASSGPSTDRNNEPVVDPTANVIALNAAQDLLRETEATHIREVLALRSDFADKISVLEQQLIDVKFAGVEQVRALTENHRLELKGDGEKQLTAALSASKEAVSEQNKSNTLSTDRAVNGMKELIITNAQLGLATTTALSEKVEDLKSQVAILVNQKIGANEQRTEQRSASGAVYALVGVVSGLLFGVIGIIITVLLR